MTPDPNPTLILGADHAGFALKENLRTHLLEQGFSVEDVGCFSAERVDYPAVSARVAQRVTAHQEAYGILCCGSGVGVAMSANRFPKIRAVVAHDLYTAQMSRRHNDANVLCLGGRLIAPELACEILKTWLATPFEGGRHADRVALMDTLTQDENEVSSSC